MGHGTEMKELGKMELETAGDGEWGHWDSYRDEGTGDTELGTRILGQGAGDRGMGTWSWAHGAGDMEE